MKFRGSIIDISGRRDDLVISTPISVFNSHFFLYPQHCPFQFLEMADLSHPPKSPTLIPPRKSVELEDPGAHDLGA